MAVTAKRNSSSKRRSAAEDKRLNELSRRFRSSSSVQRARQQYHQQQPTDGDENGTPLIEWTSHAWTVDELVRLYSRKLPVIVRATRGYYGRPGGMQLEVGQVRLLRCFDVSFSLGPFHEAIAVPSVTRCRCRRRRCRHRCAGGVRRDSSDTWWMAMRRAAARSGEWAQHFSNASCS